MYIQTLQKIALLMFALDHPNYARSLPVHIRDMMLLDECHSEFKKGNFEVENTQHAFSGISLDHAHEQNNKLVGGDGGAIGLTENSSQLLRWIVSGPEFECSLEVTKGDQGKKPNCRCHEQRKGVQKAFKKQVKSLST